MQVGPAVKTCGKMSCEATFIIADLQQIWPGHSVSSVQVFSQLEEQRPLQQSRAELEVQFEDVVQVWGQASYFGFRHRPDTFRLGSTLRTDVQQISPEVVSHSELVEQEWGHCEGGKQMDWL